MINVSRLGDDLNRSLVEINQTSDEGRSAWRAHLTATLPPVFENSDRRQVDLSVVDFKDLKNDSPNVMFLPLIVAAVTRVGEQTRVYYRSRYNDNSKVAPTLTLDGYVTQETGELIDNPWLRVELGVLPSIPEQTARVADGPIHLDKSTVHTDRNENANGGLDIPVDQINKTDLQERASESA